MKEIKLILKWLSIILIFSTTVNAQSITYYADLVSNFNIINKQSTAEWYRLNDTISRAELSKISSNVWWFKPIPCTWKIFYDVDLKLWDLCWYIEALADVWKVSIKTKYFRPHDSITRAEALKILLGVIWERKSDRSAGYIDTINLGDLEWYINKAKELWSIADVKYIYPNSAILRHEVFVLASFYAGLDTSMPAFTTKEVVKVNNNIVATKDYTAKTFDKYLLWRTWYDSTYLAYANSNPSEAEFVAKCDKIKEIELEYTMVPDNLYWAIKNSSNPCQEWSSYWIYDRQNTKWMYRSWDEYAAYICDFDYNIEWSPAITTSWYKLTITDLEKKTCWQIWLKQEGY